MGERIKGSISRELLGTRKARDQTPSSDYLTTAVYAVVAHS